MHDDDDDNAHVVCARRRPCVHMLFARMKIMLNIFCAYMLYTTETKRFLGTTTNNYMYLYVVLIRNLCANQAIQIQATDVKEVYLCICVYIILSVETILRFMSFSIQFVARDFLKFSMHFYCICRSRTRICRTTQRLSQGGNQRTRSACSHENFNDFLTGVFFLI